MRLKEMWQKVDNFVLGNFSPRDYGTRSKKQALKKQADHMRNKTRYGYENNYMVGKRMANGGDYDISYYDMRKRLQKFGYSTKGLRDDQIFDKYSHVIGLSVNRLLKKGGK